MKKITVIEDNDDVRDNLVEILELTGYEVTFACNGKEGVERIKEVKPDLVLCDVMMPILDGFGVLKIVNSDPELMNIPFMFLTAKAEKTDFRKGMGLGADDYIVKPYDDVELLESIEIRLKKYERYKELESTSPEGPRTFFDEQRGQKELEHLAEGAEVRKYVAKDIVYESNQFPKWIYMVESGLVKCYQTNDFGKDLITQVYGPGDVFGYLPFLRNGRYQDAASTIEETVLRLISPEDFKNQLYNNKDFAARIIKLIATHADEAQSNQIDLAYSTVRRKLANALLILNKKNSGEKFKISREDLAALAGTAKETTIRNMSDFKSEKILEINDGYILIINKEALENMPQ